MAKICKPQQCCLFYCEWQELAGKCFLLTVFLRSCKNLLKFNAVVKSSGYKLLRNVTFQQDILEQTTACHLQGPTELRAVTRHLFNGLHGWSDLSFRLDSLYGHAGYWQAMCQPCNRSRRIRSTLCSHCIQQSCSNLPGFATEATSSAASCYAVENFVRFACSSSSVLQGYRFTAELRPWGDVAGTQSCYATLHFAYGCSSWSCCAKHFLSNHPDSCLPMMVMVVSFPLTSESAQPWKRCVSCDPRGAHVGRCICALHFGLCSNRARARGCGSPSKSALWGSGHLRAGGPKASFAGTIPAFAWEGFTVQRAALRARALETEEDRLVLL